MSASNSGHLSISAPTRLSPLWPDMGFLVPVSVQMVSGKPKSNPLSVFLLERPHVVDMCGLKSHNLDLRQTWAINLMIFAFWLRMTWYPPYAQTLQFSCLKLFKKCAESQMTMDTMNRPQQQPISAQAGGNGVSGSAHRHTITFKHLSWCERSRFNLHKIPKKVQNFISNIHKKQNVWIFTRWLKNLSLLKLHPEVFCNRITTQNTAATCGCLCTHWSIIVVRCEPLGYLLIRVTMDTTRLWSLVNS